MRVCDWICSGVADAIQAHDTVATRSQDAFSEKLERPQAKILQARFNRLENVTATENFQYRTASAHTADLVLNSSDGNQIVCEIKAMYKTWFKRNGRPYPAYLWSPFENPSKEHSAANDLWKLSVLAPPDATHIAQIILGSSLPVDAMAKDLDKYAGLAHISSDPWQAARVAFDNCHHRGYEYDIRVWCCPREDVATWQPKVAKFFASSRL